MTYPHSSQNPLEKQELSRNYPENISGNFTIVPNTFLDACADLSPKAALLYIHLLRYRNMSKGVAFPSYTRLIKDSGICRRAIASAIKELEDAGWLTREIRRGTSAIYHFTEPDTGAKYARVPMQNMHGGGAKYARVPVQNMHPNNTNREIQNNNTRERDTAVSLSHSCAVSDTTTGDMTAGINWQAPEHNVAAHILALCKLWDYTKGRPVISRGEKLRQAMEAGAFLSGQKGFNVKDLRFFLEYWQEQHYSRTLSWPVNVTENWSSFQEWKTDRQTWDTRFQENGDNEDDW